MKHITILAVPHGLAATVLGPMDVFRNAGLQWHGNKPSGTSLCKVEVVSPGGGPVPFGNRLMVQPHRDLASVEQTDLLWVSSPGPGVIGFLETHPETVNAIRALHQRGIPVAGVCAGVFLLAEAGLLDGKTATTHWLEQALFRARYPRVNLKVARMITDEGDVLCAGGVYAALDLALYLLEKYHGRETALGCAKTLILNPGRTSQAPYTQFEFQKRHGDDKIKQVQIWMEAHLTETIAMEQLAEDQGMSPRHFTRRFKKATGDTPLFYQQRLRMAAAGRLLEKADCSVEEASRQVGYQDVDFFRRLFKQHMGLTPSAYRGKIRPG